MHAEVKADVFAFYISVATEERTAFHNHVPGWLNINVTCGDDIYCVEIFVTAAICGENRATGSRYFGISKCECALSEIVRT